MRRTRGFFDAVTLNGHIYVVGGRALHNGEIYKGGEIYYPGVDKWYDLPEMATPRTHSTVEAMNGSLYCVGGLDDSSFLTSVERWDPRGDRKWHKVTILGRTPETSLAETALLQAFGVLVQMHIYTSLLYWKVTKRHTSSRHTREYLTVCISYDLPSLKNLLYICLFMLQLAVSAGCVNECKERWTCLRSQRRRDVRHGGSWRPHRGTLHPSQHHRGV
jgi:hypothetical protein